MGLRRIPSTIARNVVALLLIVVLAGCGSGGSAAPARVLPSASSAGLSRNTGAASAPAAQPSANPTASALDSSTPANRKVIYNGTINIEVSEVNQAISALGGVASDEGGYVANTDVQPTLGHAQLTLKVRADRYEAALQRIRGIAKRVVQEHTTSQDVTQQYFDLDTRIKSLKSAHDTYVGLLRNAKTTDDVLKIQSQISTIEGQIDELEGQQNYLANRTEFATITVVMATPEASPTPTAVPDNSWHPDKTASTAWGSSLVVLRALGDLAITIIFFGWWVILLGLVAYGVLRSRGAKNHAIPTQKRENDSEVPGD